MPEILLLNGPNLGSLGQRQPELYGTTTLAEIVANVEAVVGEQGFRLLAFQSNIEGALIDFLEGHPDAAGAVVNPGALMMGGWSLRDALADFRGPWVEVHLTNVWARESFRHTSVTGGLAVAVVMGLGAMGYRLAADALLEVIQVRLR